MTPERSAHCRLTSIAAPEGRVATLAAEVHQRVLPASPSVVPNYQLARVRVAASSPKRHVTSQHNAFQVIDIQA